MKKAPERTCVGCLQKKPKKKLVRLIVKNGKIIVDPTGMAGGRGLYLCQKGKGVSQTCLDLAKEKNAFQKVFKGKIKSAASRRGLRSY